MERQLGIERFLCENADWDTVLLLATKQGHLETVRFAVKNGADFKSNGTPCVRIITPVRLRGIQTASVCPGLRNPAI